MKTLLAAIEMPPAVGGVETYYGNLVRYWPDELSVIDNAGRRLVNPSLPFLKWLPALFSLSSAIRNMRPDWIIAGEILPVGTAVWILRKFFTFKYAVFLHGLDFSAATVSGRKRRLSKRILERADRVLCANSYTGALVQKLAPSAKIEVVNPGVDAERPAVTPTLRSGLAFNYDLEGRFVLLSVGRLVRRKGIDMVLRALPQVIERVPKFRYIIIGNGPEAGSIGQLIDELKLDAYVTLLTDIDDNRKHAWLDLADAFIMTSRNLDGNYEGFGIVYLEAGLHAKPVIAGRSGGVSDAVENGVTGFQVDEEDPSAIARAILELAEHPEIASRLGAAGLERAKRFAWPQQISIIHSLLSRP